MSQTRFPWRWLIFLIFCLIGGLVAYDVHSSKGFKKSKTHQVLADAGILVFLEQVWHRVGIFSGKVAGWLQDNVPFYYAKVCEFVGPYLQLFWEKLYDFGIFIIEATKPARLWLNEKIPLLLDWFQTQFPWFWDGLVYYSSIVWDFIVKCSLWAWEHIVCATHCTTTWLLENVFTGSLSPENILKTLSSLLITLQSYITAAIQWIINVVQGDENAQADTTIKQQ